MRPLIGISTSTQEREQGQIVQLATFLNLSYSHAIYQAGGMPVLLPSVPADDDAAELLSHLDGLLLSGGGDVDPAFWGEEPHPNLGKVDLNRDRLEIALAQQALAREIPMLGICRGIQVMAVALGGDLWQDIPTQVPGNTGHFQTGHRHEYSHHVTVQPDSALARILYPDAPIEACGVPVNSFHHQAARNHGPHLTPIAWADDGLIEALAAPDALFVLGVQWHPEDMAPHDPRHANLFAAFVQAARDYARQIPGASTV